MKLSNGGEANHKGMRPFLLGSWTLKTPCKDFNLAILGGLNWMKWLKKRAGKFCISCNCSCPISFLWKILLVKLKYLYIQYAWISIMKKQNSNQNGKVEKMMVPVKTFDHCHHKFQIFQLSCKTVNVFKTEI